MRKALGLFVAIGVLGSVLAAIGPPAGAAAGKSCSTVAGTGVFKPPLPDLNSTTKVKDVLTIVASIRDCAKPSTGAQGKLTGVSARSKGANCQTFLAGARKM